jgi:hypothetical protein
LNSFSAIRSTGIIAIQLVCPLLFCSSIQVSSNSLMKVCS